MNYLRELREKKGISQTELAASIGVGARYIAFIEKNERRPSLSLALRIANFFDMQIEDIFLPVNSTECIVK